MKDSQRGRAAEAATRPAGVGGELKQLRSDSTESIGELREFISGMHGKSPQEVLGTVAESGLVQSTLISAVGFAVLLLAFTAGPYFLAGGTETQSTSTAGKQSQTPAVTSGISPQEAPTATAPPEPDPAQAVKALGIDEVKTADPKQNPLDKNLDKLLDGID